MGEDRLLIWTAPVVPCRRKNEAAEPADERRRGGAGRRWEEPGCSEGDAGGAEEVDVGVARKNIFSHSSHAGLIVAS